MRGYPKFYQESFDTFIEELTMAREEVLDWWQDLLDATGATTPEEAENVVRPRWPAGPVSHPRVLEVIRRHYKAVDDYNELRRYPDSVSNQRPMDSEAGWGDEAPSEDDDITVEPSYLLDNLGSKHGPLESFVKELVVIPFGIPPKETRRAPSSYAVLPKGNFKFETIHRLDRGIRRLLEAPKDLPPSAPWTTPPISREKAQSSYRALFAQYASDLAAALADAEQWWKGIVDRHQQRGFFRRRKTALKDAYNSIFAGPAEHGQVIWVIQKYWVECAALNQASPESHRVPPEILLLQWLVDEQHDSWVQALTCLPYWPVGLDANGNWV